MIMTGVRYIISTVIATSAIASLVVLFVVVVDPYGFFPGMWHPGGDNAARMPDPFGDNRVIRTALFFRQPKTVLIGSSRMVRGYEAARLKGSNLAPAYNAGFYGHGLKNRLQMLEIALRLDRSVETAVIEVFTMDVMHDLRMFWQMPLSRHPDTASYASLFWSTRALGDSLSALAESAGWANSPSVLARSGADQTPLRILPAAATINYSMFPPKAQLNPDWEDTIDAMHRVCLRSKVSCKFIIAPISARALFGYYYFGQWQVIERLKRKFASIGAEVHDFLWLNRFTAEFLGDGVNHWEDPIHHSVEVGNFVLDTLAGKAISDAKSWERFSTLLTKDNVEADLLRLQAQLERWSSDNPELAWSYSVVTDNIANPVGTSSVTGDGEHAVIAVNGRTWSASGGVGGRLAWNAYSHLSKLGVAMGWGADISRRIPAERVAVTCGPVVLGWARPMYELRGDPELKDDLVRTGFYFSYPVSKENSKDCDLPKFYSLFADGSARELAAMTKVVPLR